MNVLPFVDAALNKYCKAEKYVVKTYNTSNLVDHIKKKHPVDFEDYKGSKKEQEERQK